MDHLQAFEARQTLPLGHAGALGWTLKRYAIIASERQFDETVMAAATEAAFEHLPPAGTLEDSSGNHGVGFQIIHFAQTAIVSPVFYWQWGSVLSRLIQLRAPLDAPCDFSEGSKDVVGCVWELDLIGFEVAAWKATLMGGSSAPEDRLMAYLSKQAG